ncbi:uncharacterized protein LOC116020460 [Ipomoea triloba]|uniref:uncharacterized protein LOC116020460 n=1 Tax=Ipomoea triloba TaxID=35885 RepID=UPI00125CEB5D|nr:uncharacterized protein LOC116020460 [Ipomoea triloba]
MAEENLHGECEGENNGDSNMESSNDGPHQKGNTKAAGPSKGKRATVQVSEKQIEGNNKHGIITWNCQGAASNSFVRAAKWIIDSHKPDVFCLLETKTSGNHATEVCKKLKYANWARVEALGYSGGISTMWKEELQVDIIRTNPQFMHLLVVDRKNRTWNLTVVYGSPSLHLRRRLWSALSREKTEITSPWLVAGDFNAVTSTDECSNPENVGNHRNSDFKNWIFEEALLDLGYKGQKFTWKRGREGETFKGARLDRALCSTNWLDTFPDTSVTHLTMLKSDHCPILMEFDKPQARSHQRFMFQGA